jgi:preprotein translocase subunit SecD
MTQARARLLTWTDSLLLPDGDRALLAKVIDEEDDEDAGWRTYIVKGPATITGADVADATAQEDPSSGGAHVAIELTRAGGERFAALTKVSVKRRVAIVIDREVKSAPVVQGEIKGGFVSISMGRGPSDKQLADAKQLAAALRGD